MTNTGLIKDNGKFLIPFLLNKDDAEKYTCKSNQKIWFVCPKCGQKKYSFVAHFVSASEATRYLNEHYEQNNPIGSATIRSAIKSGSKSVRGYELKNIKYKGD